MVRLMIENDTDMTDRGRLRRTTQRVAIARAIATRPRLLLADQATSDLDAGNRNKVIELLRNVAASGAAVLLASDDPAVLSAANRTVVLDRSGPVNYLLSSGSAG